MQAKGEVGPSGSLALRLIKQDGSVHRHHEPHPWPTTLALRDILAYGVPQRGLPDEVNEWRRSNRPHLARRLRKVLVARAFRVPTFYGALFLEKYDAKTDRLLPLGLASLAVVTTVGVNFMVDAFQNLEELEDMKFHGFGTGGAAEAVGNTALTTELTTQYATDNTRPTGSQTEASANVYRTVGTLDPDADVAITEHGIFDQAATGGGVLLDRTLFSVVNVDDAGDTLQATYDFTITAGS